MISKEELNIVFKSFNEKNILIIGDVMIDSYIIGKVERISPEAPVPVVSVSRRDNRLGGAANVALNVQSLGATPIICSIIGNDNKAVVFEELLTNEKLTTEGIIRSSNRITTTKYRVIGNNVQLLRVDEETEKDADLTETNQLIRKIAKIIKRKTIHAIIFEDYDKGVISSALIESITEVAKNKGIPVCVDPKKKNFDYYKNITLFKPNLKELKEGLKIDINFKNKKELEKIADRLHSTKNIQNILLTLSSEGVFVSFKKDKLKSETIPAHLRNIADVSGAGDTVISVAALCLCSGLSAFDTAKISNLAGGIVCEFLGVVPINKDILLKECIKLFPDKTK